MKIVFTNITNPELFIKIREIEFTGKVYSFKIDPSDKFLFACPNSKFVQKWDISDIKQLKKVSDTSIQCYSSFDSAFDFSENFKVSYFICNPSMSHIWVTGENFKTRKYHSYNKNNKEVLTMTYNSKLKWLLTSGRDSRLIIYNVRSDKAIKKMKIVKSENVYNIKISDCLKYMFIGVNNMCLHVYSTSTFEKIKSFKFHKNVFCILQIKNEVYYSGWVTNNFKKFQIL